MSSLKETIERLKKLEAEKLSLIAEVEELRKIAEGKSNALANEIAALREEVNSLKILMQPEKPQGPSEASIKEKKVAAVSELAEKTLNESNRLGNQVFACSPFSQNFDNWLANLRQIVSDFESNSPIKVDDQFIKDYSQILLDIESTLAQKKVEETKVGAVAFLLADNNHLLVEADKEYTENARKLGLKKDAEITRLSKRVQELELAVQNEEEVNNKRKILKKKTANKLPQRIQELKSAKAELRDAQQDFISEQDKLRLGYEKKKREIIEQVEILGKELAALDIDTSFEARKTASEALANAVNAQIQRIVSAS